MRAYYGSWSLRGGYIGRALMYTIGRYATYRSYEPAPRISRWQRVTQVGDNRLRVLRMCENSVELPRFFYRSLLDPGFIRKDLFAFLDVQLTEAGNDWGDRSEVVGRISELRTVVRAKLDDDGPFFPTIYEVMGMEVPRRIV